MDDGFNSSDPAEPTPLEGLRRLAPAEVRFRMPQIRYGILDTNVLLKNIGRDVRDHPRPTRMRLITAIGAFRAYVGPHVVGEVEEHIDAWTLARGRDVALARRIWEEEYRPRLWVVDPGPPTAGDEQLSALAVRDLDDLATAQLAILLGQKALSEDRDLADDGLASGDQWLDSVLATGAVAWGETVDFGVGVGLTISMQTMTDGYGLVREIARTEGGRRALLLTGAGLLILLVGLLLLRHLHEPSRQWIDEKAGLAARTLASGGKIAVGAYANVSFDRIRGETTLSAGVVTEACSPSPLQLAARTLATAEAPVTTRDLAAEIWGYRRVPAAVSRSLRGMLKRVPAFIEVEPDRWQLGRRGA